MKYMIVSGKSAGDIEELMQDLVKDGWEPTGGLCVTDDAEWHGHTFYQAVIKRERTELRNFCSEATVSISPATY